MSPPKFEIFIVFSNFLSLKSLGNSWSNSCTKFVILDVKFPFTCAKTLLSSKILWPGLSENFPFQWWFKFPEKKLIWLKKASHIKKLQISNVWKLSKAKLWPKANMQNSAFTKPSDLELECERMTCFKFSFKIGETLWSYRKY